MFRDAAALLKVCCVMKQTLAAGGLPAAIAYALAIMAYFKSHTAREYGRASQCRPAAVQWGCRSAGRPCC